MMDLRRSGRDWAEGGLVVDLDGTILDVSERHHRLYVEFVEAAGASPLAKDVYWQLIRTRTQAAQILVQSGISPDRAEEYGSFRRSRIEGWQYLQTDSVLDAARAGLEETRERDRYLVTLRQDRQSLIRQLEMLDLYAHFKEILCAGPLRLNKTTLVSSLGMPDESWVLIGDTEADMSTARELGMIGIGVTSGLRDARVLEAEGAVAILPDLGALPAYLNEKVGDVAR